jgi:acyl carrier protein
VRDRIKFIKFINTFFNRNVKKNEMIFYECDSLKLIKLILELEKFLEIPKKLQFKTKKDLYEIFF